MTDRLDVKIRALVVELVDQPVEPPSFPMVETEASPGSVRRAPRWSVALAVFIWVLVLGGLSLLVLQWIDRAPVVDTPPTEPIETFAVFVTAGEGDAALAMLDQAQCFAPGQPSCQDLIGFFVAANARIGDLDCEVTRAPFYQCSGYLHTDIHDTLGISEEELAQMPNFGVAFELDGATIKRFNFDTPFTGDGRMDARMWAYMLETGASFADEDGVPRFSADIVDEFIEAARGFIETEEGQ